VPELPDVTAFRSEMAVHGRYGEPCPDWPKTIEELEERKA
jgi:hypothetical protein